MTKQTDTLDAEVRASMRNRQKGITNFPPDAVMLTRFLLEDANGQPLATALYAVPVALRPAAFTCELGMFEQVRQTDAGTWVYRKWQDRHGRTADMRLVEYRFPNDADWDGPRPVAIPDAVPLNQRVKES